MAGSGPRCCRCRHQAPEIHTHLSMTTAGVWLAIFDDEEGQRAPLVLQSSRGRLAVCLVDGELARRVDAGWPAARKMGWPQPELRAGGY